MLMMSLPLLGEEQGGIGSEEGDLTKCLQSEKKGESSRLKRKCMQHLLMDKRHLIS